MYLEQHYNLWNCSVSEKYYFESTLVSPLLKWKYTYSYVHNFSRSFSTKLHQSKPTHLICTCLISSYRPFSENFWQMLQIFSEAFKIS